MMEPETNVPANQSRPIIGVALPSYHAADTLEETLRSLVSQTLTSWVAFITVEGPNAGAEEEIVRRLGDPRIYLECNGELLRQMPNFNRAVLRCYAAGVRWIKTMSADDVLYPHALETMLQVGDSNPECRLVYGFFNMIDAAGSLISRTDVTHIKSQVFSSPDFIRKMLPIGNIVGGPSSVMFRADVVERVGLFDGSLNYTGDREFWLRIVSQFAVGVVGGFPVLAYRRHSNSVSGREHKTAACFSQPLDVARMSIARFPPFSANWVRAHVQLGRVAASNLMTTIASLRRGHIKVAFLALRITAGRITPISSFVAAFRFVHMLGRYLAGVHPGVPSELAPEPTRVSGARNPS